MLDLTSDKTMLNIKHPDPLMEPQQKIKGPPLSNFSKVWSQAAAGWHGSIRVLQHCPMSERLRGKKGKWSKKYVSYSFGSLANE